VALDDIGSIYAEALFEVAKENDKLDEIHEQLAQVVEAIDENRELQVFFFSPYFTSGEKREGISKAFVGAEPELVNFLELMAEKHRMPAIFAARRIFDELWAAERRRLEVRLTSAVELDPKVVKKVGEEIERRTGREIDLEAVVDDDILGGLVLRVGNMICDASVRGKLERLRREVAQAA
jgi:F-type H+-transporting ATPase subunit delta